MDIAIEGIKEVLGTVTVGLIPAEIVAIVFALIVVFLITRMDYNKTIMAFAPTLFIISALGFNVNVIFLIIAVLAFAIYLFVGATFGSSETPTTG